MSEQPVWDDPLTGSPGKRLSTADPLTEHDVADRLDKALLRAIRIMSDARQQGYMDLVKRSRYLTNTPGMMAAELKLWGAEPQQGYEDDYPGYSDRSEDQAATENRR